VPDDAEFDRRVAGFSPDRVDALVRAVTGTVFFAKRRASIIDFYRKAGEGREVGGGSSFSRLREKVASRSEVG